MGKSKLQPIMTEPEVRVVSNTANSTPRVLVSPRGFRMSINPSSALTSPLFKGATSVRSTKQANEITPFDKRFENKAENRRVTVKMSPKADDVMKKFFQMEDTALSPPNKREDENKTAKINPKKTEEYWMNKLKKLEMEATNLAKKEELGSLNAIFDEMERKANESKKNAHTDHPRARKISVAANSKKLLVSNTALDK